jgi:hypothetical protein
VSYLLHNLSRTDSVACRHVQVSSSITTGWLHIICCNITTVRLHTCSIYYNIATLSISESSSDQNAGFHTLQRQHRESCITRGSCGGSCGGRFAVNSTRTSPPLLQQSKSKKFSPRDRRTGGCNCSTIGQNEQLGARGGGGEERRGSE